MDSSSQNPGLPKVRASDLTDPNLWRLNRNFDDLYGKIVALYGGAGPIKIGDVITSLGFSVPTQATPPTDPSEVLTLRAALQLFSPANIRNALVSGSFQTQPTETVPAQRIPGGTGSGSGSGGAGGGGGVITVTLTANTSITTAAPSADGNLLNVFVIEDGTGGWTITWDAAAFQAGTLTGIDTRANKTTVFTFVGYSGKWSQLDAAFTQGTGLASLNGTVASTQLDTENLLVGVAGTAYATNWKINAAVLAGVNHLYLIDPSGSSYIDFDGLGNRNARFLSNVIPQVNNFYTLGVGANNWANVWTNSVQSSVAATLTIGTTVAQAISIQANSTERIRLAGGSALATITADVVPATDKGYALGSGSLHWGTLWSDTIVSATASNMTVGPTNAHSLNLQVNGSTRVAIDGATAKVTITGDTLPATDKTYALGSGSLHWASLWCDTIVSATSSNMSVGPSNSHGLNLQTNGSTRMAIDSAGLVTVTGNTSFTTLFGITESAANGVGASITGNFPLGLINNNNGTASQNAWFVQLGTGTVGIYSGSGSPETVISAAIGSIFLRTNGGAGTSIYIKESGSGNTGWAAK